MRHFLAIAATAALICATAAPAAAQGDGKVQIVRGSSVEIWTPGSERASPAVLRGTLVTFLAVLSSTFFYRDFSYSRGMIGFFIPAVMRIEEQKG